MVEEVPHRIERRNAGHQFLIAKTSRDRLRAHRVDGYQQDGYRQPASYSACCAVCGTAMGEPGIFRQIRERRASKAGWN
jgi:hypothetical protein